MNITDVFIRRPVLALVVNLLIGIAGLQAVRTLNVRQYPRSENAAVTVTTAYIGASADLVRGFVTTPLERTIAAADGIEYMESQSSLGLSNIKVRLKLNYQYPYEASGTGIVGALIPRSAQVGGRDAMMKRITGELRDEIRAEVKVNIARRGGADTLLISRYTADPSIEGQRLSDLAARANTTPEEFALQDAGKG